MANTFSETLPRVLQRPYVINGSLSVARVLSNAIELIKQGDFPEVSDDDIYVIQGNLEILLAAVG